MKGRKPTPSAVLELRGSRALERRGAEPKPPRTMPTCPTFLSGAAKEEWRRLAPKLHKMGLLTGLDRGALAIICQAWGAYTEATELVARDGAVIETATGRRVKHPAVSIINQATQTMLRFGAGFGLTPGDRARLSIPGDNGADDFERFLAAKKKDRFFKPKLTTA